MIRPSYLLLTFLSVAIGCARPNSVSLIQKPDEAKIDEQIAAKWDDRFMRSGTIVLSRQIPQTSEKPSQVAMEDSGESKVAQFGPIIGYIPPTLGLADNEVWLEIDSKLKTINVYKGQNKLQALHAEGVVGLAPGTYALQHKQKRPLWYAPDSYFTKRGLPVPNASDKERYRRGALGGLVLYPTTTFPIHTAPIWTDDVGGLKVPQGELASVYFMLPVGSTVIVK